VRAVGILDQVLTGGRHADPVYRGRRDGAFIIAVECTELGATCFCTSMGCGPGVESGFDLAMTELADAESHRFVVRAGTPAGADVLSDVPRRAADEATRRRASTAVDEAADHMGRTMPALGLPQLLADRGGGRSTGAGRASTRDRAVTRPRESFRVCESAPSVRENADHLSPHQAGDDDGPSRVHTWV
jgi:hypothetical protein